MLASVRVTWVCVGGMGVLAHRGNLISMEEQLYYMVIILLFGFCKHRILCLNCLNGI